MATAQLLQLYYTKNNTNQERNKSKYFHYQQSKVLQQEQQAVIIPQNQSQTSPQNKITYSKLTEDLFCFQSKVNDNKNFKNLKPTFQSKENITHCSWNPVPYEETLVEKNKNNVNWTTKSSDLSQSPLTGCNEDFKRNAYERIKFTTKFNIPKKKSCSWWNNIFSYPKGESFATTDDVSIFAYATKSEHNQQYKRSPYVSEATISPTNLQASSRSVLSGNHIHYKLCSSKSSPLFIPKFSTKGLETSKNGLSLRTKTINNFIRKSYKQPKEKTRAKKYLLCQSAAQVISKFRNRKEECCANCTSNVAQQWEGKYASQKKATTTKSSKTKNYASSCQHNNIFSNCSLDVVSEVIDKTRSLQNRINSFRNETAGICLLCKYKPNTCQRSKSSNCCKKCCHNKPTLRNWGDYDAERLQSSNISSTSNFTSLFGQSGSTKTSTTTLSQVSSKKQSCRNDKLQYQQLRQQRKSRTYNINYPKSNKRKWPPRKSNKTNQNPANSDFPEIKPNPFLATKKSSIEKNRNVCRKLSWNAIIAVVDVQRLTRAILPFIIIFNMLPLLYAECDQTFVSRVGGPQNGKFSAPLIHNPKNHSRQCLYIFLAGPGQRVEVVFTVFNLRGSPPDGSAVGELPTCVHEYMDIYSEVQSSDPADLINSPFGGRFCGTIPPRRRISMHRAIAISFFTNKNVSEPDLFEGNYKFLNASEYEIGIPIAGSPCSYTITPSMSLNKTGSLISPTYPGAYPKDMSCTYQFLGEANQRVRLEFRDFDLFFGGPHCPFDFVKVYDGPDNSSALIGTYCGQQRNLVLYSSESSLFVHFYTLPRTANTQNRGFKGIYEFSESFVKLDFIRENDGIHIRGSECDQKILSKKESTGFVLSPNYPYPYIPKTVCRYFIYGMQDAQHLERVRLEFSSFDIPKVENKDKSETNCSDGYLKIYLKGQETADAYDKFDYELCGNETQKVVSDGPRLAMVFSSGEWQGRGFKGKYTFETEYKIPGTAAPDGTCSFTYVSNSKKRGDLNSPRYPSNYPSETNCSYLFLAEQNEQVTIVFDHFKVKADNVNSTAGAYGASACFEDWLEIYVIYRDNNDRFLGRYCGLTAPGPVESPRGAVGLRITLHTDQENVASGFKARYFFETTKSEVGDCGGNFSNEDSGIITSPQYPNNYKSPAKGLASMACNWYITARPGYKLSINFEQFSVEGDPMARGCPAAVLRMWTNVESEAAPVELCGEKPPTEHWHYISTSQSARISFTTTDKTIGAQGFRIVWTEIQDSGPGPPAIGLLCESAYHFQCNIGYCISDKLRCDGIKNCGPGDDSDEMHCITEAPKEDHGVLIIISMAAVSFLICLLCTLCHRQKKRRHRQLGLHRNTGHYDSTASATG